MWGDTAQTGRCLGYRRPKPLSPVAGRCAREPHAPPKESALFPTHRRMGGGRQRSSPATCLSCLIPTTVIFKEFCVRQPCFSRVSFLLDFFEIQRCFVDCRTKFYSNAMFSWKGGSFHCNILFFLNFSDFQRLV